MERKRKRQKNKNELLEPTKEELEIAKHIRFKTPKKSTTINKQDVEYFTGSKAVDTIMASKWATSKSKSDFKFNTRDQAVDFMNTLLQREFFYRAMKNHPDKDKNKKAENTEVETIKSSSKSNVEDSPKSLRQRRKRNENKNEQKEESGQDSKKKEKTKEKNKVKRRYKLTVHEEQIFTDTNDIFIWIYSPTHPKTIFFGILLLIGVVGATLFPLWPPIVRTGVYYASLTGAGLIGSIFVIALARSILFAVLWVCTMGNIKLWLLPNILADVGFFDSFKPLYTYENKSAKSEEENEKDEPSDKPKETSNEGDIQDNQEDSNITEDAGKTNSESAEENKIEDEDVGQSTQEEETVTDS